MIECQSIASAIIVCRSSINTGGSLGSTTQPEHFIVQWHFEQLKPLSLTVFKMKGLHIELLSIHFFQSRRSHHLETGLWSLEFNFISFYANVHTSSYTRLPLGLDVIVITKGDDNI